jgi:nicotinamide-nucleotide amidase
VVASQMALGVCRVLGSAIGVATTGVAGPEPQDGRAVGTVYVAVALAGSGVAEVRALALTGDRAAVRAGTVRAALDLVAQVAGRTEELRQPGR